MALEGLLGLARGVDGGWSTSWRVVDFKERGRAQGG
jgi:hypothetical protein